MSRLLLVSFAVCCWLVGCADEVAPGGGRDVGGGVDLGGDVAGDARVMVDGGGGDDEGVEVDRGGDDEGVEGDRGVDGGGG